MNLRSDTATKIAFALARSYARAWRDKAENQPLLTADEWAKANYESFLKEAEALLPDPMDHVYACCPCCGEAGDTDNSDKLVYRCTNPHCNVCTYIQIYQ
jgi:hypothetical protein